jgi:hypothetical protein
MLAYLVGRPTPPERPATLLAVADPAYPKPKGDAPTPEPPAAGLAVARVVPNGNADLNGIREGDVLLNYAGARFRWKSPGVPADTHLCVREMSGRRDFRSTTRTVSPATITSVGIASRPCRA